MIKLLRFLKPYRVPVVFVLLLVFLQSLSDLYLPTLMADIIDKGVTLGDRAYIWKVGGFMLFIAAVGGVCSIGASYLSAKAAGGFGKDLRSRVFSHVERFSLNEFDKIGTASLITRTTNDITQVQMVLTMMMRVMIMAPLMCFGGIIMALSKDVKLSFIIIAIVPVLALIILALTRPSRHSWKPVTSETSVTGTPAAAMRETVEPVETMATPASFSPRARSSRPVLS